VRNCAEPPEHLRSEISFLRTYNIPNLTSHIYRIALSKISLVVSNMVACALTQIFAQCKTFLQGTLLVTNFTNLCRHVDKWNKR